MAVWSDLADEMGLDIHPSYYLPHSMWLSDCNRTSLLLANDVPALQGRRCQQLLLSSVGKAACGQHKRDRQHACDPQCGPPCQRYGFVV